jgi:predicted small metal-binding protein
MRSRRRWTRRRDGKGTRGAYDVTVKQIDCVCGVVVKGEDDDELWQQAQAHLRTDHPDLVEKVSREDILAQAEET